VLRVAVDGTPLLGHRTGVGASVAGLVEALAALGGLELHAYALSRRGRGALAAQLPAGVRPATRGWPARLVRAAWSRGLSVPGVEAWTGPVDVVHATNYVAPPARAPVLVSVYDLTFVHHPQWCTPDVRRYPRLLQHALRRGAWVHTMSETVAAEVRAAFSLPPDRVVVVPPGVPASAGGDPVRGRRLARADTYVLALGTVEPRKNLPRLVQARQRRADALEGVAIVIAGPDGWGTEELAAALADAGDPWWCRRLGWVDDRDRRDLLAGAAVFAYPSRYEGFGLPPLEAMAAGVPVVASSAGALPEVLGDAALLVNPDDPDALGDALARVIGDARLAATLVERGRRRVARFTWARAAAAMADRYRALAWRR
jgi:glycosyltransferase involved in cell wall biosynthesis